MMKRAQSFILIILNLGLLSCLDNHLITDTGYRELVDKKFSERKHLAVSRENELFDVFKKDLEEEESEALRFLFAFMPLSDLADYSGDFFLANTILALRSKKEYDWGKSIPEEIFLHYVLPVRVNNENLDSFRIKYYDELKLRVNSMSIREAALEINHWCHEKVTYQASDIRTSSPVATILSARGRCGEESTFTVAALRTAGIPARQVYTPRWAHSDDNHAWVEIWDNGEWYYLGACEPEPVLDRGWFTEPARRAMLVHTKSFGAYYGKENLINKYQNYSEINNLAKYAVTKTIFVRVSDTEGKEVSGASVEYKLFNYAEFFTLADVPTDQNGLSKLETGLGDLLIWASKDGKYDFKKISVEDTDTLDLILNSAADNKELMSFDLKAPVIRTPFPGINPDLVKSNEERINIGNAIRKEYIGTWIQEEEIKRFSEQKSFDSARLIPLFLKSMGNYREIYSFLELVPDTLKEKALTLLEILSDKDMRDIKANILTDHLFYCNLSLAENEKTDHEYMVKYVLNPRISNEMAGPWRSYFRSALPESLQTEAKKSPSVITEYLNSHLTIAEDENYYRTPITPVGVHELRVSDSWSRAICFVAISRSLGIPARIEEGRLIPQFFHEKQWNDVYFNDQIKPDSEKGYIKISSTDVKPVPEYYIHFTLAQFINGRYITLAYEYNRKVTDFKEYLPLPPGKYMLVTGNRISDSKVLSDLKFFDLKQGEKKNISIKLRNEISEQEMSGKVDIEKILPYFKSDPGLKKDISEKGGVLIWIDPEKEPTLHIFNDLPGLKAEFDAWKGPFMFLYGKPERSGSLSESVIKGLPSGSLFGNDTDLELLSAVTDLDTLPDAKLPFVMVIDKDGNIIFRSSGYRIGIGEQILKKIN